MRIPEQYMQLARLLANHSVRVKPGDIVLIETTEPTPVEMAKAIMLAVQDAGGYPLFQRHNEELLRQMLMRPSERQLKHLAANRLGMVTSVDAVIVCRGFDNQFALKDVPPEHMKLYGLRYVDTVQDELLNHKRWVLTRFPTNAMAQLARMSLEAFSEFYFNVCLCDYDRMAQAMVPLVELMSQTDMVRIEGPGTKLSFSIKGIPVIPCAGEKNVPDGEVFTAAVRDSVNGTITFNTPSVTKEGQLFNGVCLTFKKGKIVKATCTDGDVNRLNAFLDTDEGARYTGEFSFGVNPLILEPMRDTLFDEKIAGSIHLTPGKCYDDAPNGNKSAIHWDQVLIQRKAYGGGTIAFDGKVIRRDGIFVHPRLRGLNPDALLKASKKK